MSPDTLQGLRAEIDTIDGEIQALITQRAQCAQRIGVLKQAAGSTGNFYRAEREAQVLRRVIDSNSGPLSGEEMARLFREIMSACLALEEPLRIAFLGPEGTFTQAAALKHFGKSIHHIPLPTIDAVFREVEAGSADYGVVPVENSTEGVINHTLDLFLQSPLRVCGEVQIRIHQHVMSHAGTLSEVTRIYSHRQSLAQCRAWLDAHMPRVEQIEVSSNGEAALRARDEPTAAAIAGQTAADIYQVPVLVSNIEDQPDNTTRFLIIGTQPIAPSGDDKTALLVASRNQSGALFRLLEPLARHNVSMNRIESRPSRRGMWDYVFFIDLDGHAEEEPIASALADLREQATLFRVLGSYPKGVL